MAFFDTKAERQAYQGDSGNKDGTTKVKITVNGKEYTTKDYLLIQDVLALGDAFSCTIPNPDGKYSGKVKKGDTVKVYFADASVSGGSACQMFVGIVTDVTMAANLQGCIMRVTCADLGWHLQSNTAPVWMSLKGLRWATLLQKLIDPSWGFTSTGEGIDTKNLKVRLGRQGAQLNVAPQAYPAVLPRIQVEPGESVADILIKYARLSKLLVNVTGDGRLQVFSPDYKVKNFYSFEYHPSTSKERSKNNIQSVNFSDSIQGIMTDVSCYSVTLLPAAAYQSNNPNEGHFKGLYSNPSALPFKRFQSFADAEQLNRIQAKARAEWKAKRGEFDSWKYEVEVYGHAQNGSFFVPNVMCSINDDVLGVKGNYYVQAVKMERTMGGGTKTTLTIRKPNLLAA